jgi:ubiquinone/menaquinone biosynthesis C-methylase UbiE
MEFLKLLCCPNCRSIELSFETCTECGAVFGKDGATPIMVVEGKDVEYRCRHVGLEETARALQAAIQMPSDDERSSVYHLDPAHNRAFLDLPRGAQVLEVGCGGGQMRSYLRELGHEYVGIDISKTRVVESLRRHGGPDLLADAHRLPFRDGVFDVVYSIGSLMYMTSPLLCLQEVHRVLKPGGTFFANCAFLEPAHDSSCFHMSAHGAAAIMLQTGFELERLWPSRNYTGYDTLFAMGPTTARAIRWISPLLRLYVESIFTLKGLLRRHKGYDSKAEALDHATYAGAINWIASKPT